MLVLGEDLEKVDMIKSIIKVKQTESFLFGSSSNPLFINLTNVCVLFRSSNGPLLEVFGEGIGPKELYSFI